MHGNVLERFLFWIRTKIEQREKTTYASNHERPSEKKAESQSQASRGQHGRALRATSRNTSRSTTKKQKHGTQTQTRNENRKQKTEHRTLVQGSKHGPPRGHERCHPEHTDGRTENVEKGNNSTVCRLRTLCTRSQHCASSKLSLVQQTLPPPLPLTAGAQDARTPNSADTEPMMEGGGVRCTLCPQDVLKNKSRI